MPKTKKKRDKKYHPRPVYVPFPSVEGIKKIERQLDTAHLLVELTLPRGKLEWEDIDLLEDTLNWAIGIIHHRRKTLDKRELDEAVPILVSARKALTAIIDRKTEGKTECFVARGDEIKIISDALSIFIPMIKDALAIGAATTIREYEWSFQTALRHMREKHKQQADRA